jgi:hypothetical protein
MDRGIGMKYYKISEEDLDLLMKINKLIDKDWLDREIIDRVVSPLLENKLLQIRSENEITETEK